MIFLLVIFLSMIIVHIILISKDCNRNKLTEFTFSLFIVKYDFDFRIALQFFWLELELNCNFSVLVGIKAYLLELILSWFSQTYNQTAFLFHFNISSYWPLNVFRIVINFKVKWVSKFFWFTNCSEIFMTYITKTFQIFIIVGIFLKRIENLIYKLQAFCLVILIVIVVKQNDFLIIFYNSIWWNFNNGFFGKELKRLIFDFLFHLGLFFIH